VGVFYFSGVGGTRVVAEILEFACPGGLTARFFLLRKKSSVRRRPG
jgi:flavodoxin